MSEARGSEITSLLQQARDGQVEVSNRLLELVYHELKALAAHLMRNEPPGRTLQPTALVHEAYLRLLGADGFENRRHFMNAAAQVMRRLLVDQARARQAAKRGGAHEREEVDSIDWPVLRDYSWDQIPDLDRALDGLGATQSRALEVVMLRYCNGLTLEQISEVIGVSLATVKNDWTFARSWLKSELTPA